MIDSNSNNPLRNIKKRIESQNQSSKLRNSRFKREAINPASSNGNHSNSNINQTHTHTHTHTRTEMTSTTEKSKERSLSNKKKKDFSQMFKP